MNAPQEVPETRLRNDFVGREDAHAVDLGIGLRLSGEVTADDLEFLERHLYGGSAESVTVTSRPAGTHPAQIARIFALATA